MPTYVCTAAQGLLRAAKKGAIAIAITRTHGEVTGAPAYFAQVIFQDVTEGDHFIGGRQIDYEHSIVLCWMIKGGLERTKVAIPV